MKHISIGFVLLEKKLKSPLFQSLLAHAAANDHFSIEAVDPHDIRGSYDVIVQKVSDWIARGDVQVTKNITAAEESGAVIMDPLWTVTALLSRTTTAGMIDAAVEDLRARDIESVSAPEWHTATPGPFIMSGEWIIKPELGCGLTESHQLRRVGAGTPVDLAYPSIAQRFIPHDNTVYKVYYIDGHMTVHTKQSVEEVGYTPFDSQVQGKASPVISTPRHAPPAALADIGTAIAERFGLTLFGFDLLRCAASGRWFIVDVNYFPSYNGMGDFPARFEALCRRKAGL